MRLFLLILNRFLVNTFFKGKKTFFLCVYNFTHKILLCLHYQQDRQAKLGMFIRFSGFLQRSNKKYNTQRTFYGLIYDKITGIFA